MFWNVAEGDVITPMILVKRGRGAGELAVAGSVMCMLLKEKIA